MNGSDSLRPLEPKRCPECPRRPRIDETGRPNLCILRVHHVLKLEIQHATQRCQPE